MSATTSATTGRRYGLERVCQVWERSRSALYARRARAHHHRLGAGPARRGPPPRQSDAQLLAAIRTDLARSPFHGEGHRKVHAPDSLGGSGDRTSPGGAPSAPGDTAGDPGASGGSGTHAAVLGQAPDVPAAPTAEALSGVANTPPPNSPGLAAAPLARQRLRRPPLALRPAGDPPASTLHPPTSLRLPFTER